MRIDREPDSSVTLRLSVDEFRHLAEAVEGPETDPAIIRNMPDSYWDARDKMWAQVCQPIIDAAEEL